MSQNPHPGQALSDEALRAMASQLGDAYDNDEFALGVVVNQSLKTRGGSKLFVNVTRPGRVSIRADVACTLRFSSNTNPAISLDGGVPLDLEGLQFTDIFVTTSGTTNLRVLTW